MRLTEWFIRAPLLLALAIFAFSVHLPAAEEEVAPGDAELWLTAGELATLYGEAADPNSVFCTGEIINISLVGDETISFQQGSSSLLIQPPGEVPAIRCNLSRQKNDIRLLIPMEDWSIRGTCKGRSRKTSAIVITDCVIFLPGERYPDTDKGVVY